MKYFITLACMFLFPGAAFAATLSLVPSPSALGAGDLVQVTLTVKSAEPVNAFAGALMYPPALQVVSVSDGSSIISAWITPPQDAGGSVPFAGVVTGGFAGAGKIFSVIFRAREAGTAALALSDVRVLLNDGAGTAALVISPPLSLTIDATPRGGFTPPADSDPPEVFSALVEKGPDGRQYLAYAAQDKNSGINHYEIFESRFSGAPGAWHAEASPYLLRDQYLTSDVWVRAIDNAGNIRLESVPRSRLLRPYEMLAIMAVLMLVVWYLYRRMTRVTP